MTPTDTVEQVDRKAAAAFYGRHLARPGEVLVTAHMLAGKIDESPLIEAFACHRRAALATLPDHTRLVEAARKALPLVVGEEEAEELEKALDALTTLET
jgi:hypothetical protein